MNPKEGNMDPGEEFKRLRAELLEKGELTLKKIIHNGKEVSSLKLIVKGKHWLVEEIAEVKDGKIYRCRRTISPKRGESFIGAHLPSPRPNKEEEV